MNCEFLISDSIAALASSRANRLRAAELSIVSILNGEIGDPVTWIDKPDSGRPDRAPARAARPFQAVAEDIGAHLPIGAVFVHRPDSALALLARIQPKWRPALVVDALSLAEYARGVCGLLARHRPHRSGTVRQHRPWRERRARRRDCALTASPP